MKERGKKIDGRVLSKKIREELAEKIRKEDVDILFSLVMVGDDPVTENFVRYKIQFGRKVGILPTLFRLPKDISQEELSLHIDRIAEQSDALIVQLPLPPHIDTEYILSRIPPEKDVDVLSPKTLEYFSRGGKLIPPVTRAILHSLESENIQLKGKNIILYGYGTLVGKPFALYLEREDIPFSLIRSTTSDEERNTLLKNADIIVSGVGVSGIIERDTIRDGVIVIDAGTSESGGSVVGDLHPNAYEKTSFYTPVPGGIGPLTITSLFENVWIVWEKRRK